LLERLSTVAPPGSHQITLGHHTATVYSTVSSRSLGVKQILARHGVDAATTNLSLISGLGIYPEYERTCPVAEYVKNNGLFVPVYPDLRQHDVERVKRALAEAMPGRAGRVVDAAAMDDA
jgi:dTDP-4-amino-4,6-dideoxygalactose transaminase